VCKGLTKGGVRCSCVGAGLRYKPGVPEDGRQCEQDASLRAVLESQSVSIDVAKPGSLMNRTLKLIVEARGETNLNVTFNVTMTRTPAGSELATATSGSIRMDQPSMSAFGHHIEWVKLPPPAMWQADLDQARLKFETTTRHEFSVRLACNRGEQSCAADGDIITTVVELRSQGDTGFDSPLTSEVTFRTIVHALASCDNSKTWVGLDNVSTSTVARVYLNAYDIDMLPIRYSRAPVEFRLGSLLLPHQWNLGSNEYVAEVSAAINPGAHVLQVYLRQGWDNATQMQQDCILLEQQFVLRDPVWDSLNGFQTAAVIGVVAGVVAVALACFCFCLKKQSSAKCLVAVVPGIALQPRTWLWRN
jgi:hypothetical protein